MIITKTLQGIVALNMDAWYAQDETIKKLDKMPLKFQWTLRKNMKHLSEVADEFKTFRDELIQKRNNEWFVEGNGKCEKSIEKNKDGEDVEMLKILPDHLDEFKQYEAEMNSSLQDILLEEEDYAFTEIDIESVIDASEEKDAGIKMSDLDMLSLFTCDEESE